MAKDRIERDQVAGKLVETARGAEDPIRAMAEMMADFVMEAEPISTTVTPRGKLTLTKSYFFRSAVSPTFGKTWGFGVFSVSRRRAPGSELNLHG